MNCSPLDARDSAKARLAGTAWMPGWPRLNGAPSSVSRKVPAVPLRKAAVLGASSIPGPTTVAFPGPCAAIFAVRARTSGSAEPPAMAATVSATMDRARSIASPGTSFSPTRARKSQSSCKWSVMVGSRIERTGCSAAPRGFARLPWPRRPLSRSPACKRVPYAVAWESECLQCTPVDGGGGVHVRWQVKP